MFNKRMLDKKINKLNKEIEKIKIIENKSIELKTRLEKLKMLDKKINKLDKEFNAMIENKTEVIKNVNIHNNWIISNTF